MSNTNQSKEEGSFSGGAPEPYLCIAPACSGDCDGCNSAISPADMRKYAVRYALLRRMDPRFGMPVDWIKYQSLDGAVDAELAALSSQSEAR